MSNEVIYDLYSCAGGAAVGYKRAGFRTVIGVDNRPSPRYPFEFHQADALEVLRALARGRRPWPGAPWPTAIHSSPPCQFKALATLSQRLAGAEYPDLIGPTRDLLEQVGVPWIIENVPGASLRPDIRLCGCQFGLTLPGVGYLKRERWFETSWHGFYLEMPHVHRGRAISIAGHGTPSWMREKAGHIGVAEWRQVMGVDWTTRAELTEALPPAFTKYVGGLLLERVAFKEAA